MTNNKKVIVEHLAEEIQEIRSQLIDLLVNKNYQSISTKKEMRFLSMAINKIDDYRNNMENRCFDKGYIDNVEVFYGLGAEKKEAN